MPFLFSVFREHLSPAGMGMQTQSLRTMGLWNPVPCQRRIAGVSPALDFNRLRDTHDTTPFPAENVQ